MMEQMVGVTAGARRLEIDVLLEAMVCAELRFRRFDVRHEGIFFVQPPFWRDESILWSHRRQADGWGKH